MIVAESQMDRALQALAEMPAAAGRAMARALNRSALAGRQSAVQSITDRYAVKASDVRAKISLSTATPDKLEVAITARSPALSLGYFPHAPTQPGTGGPGRPKLRAEILRGQAKEFPGAFVAMINGKPRIMVRTGALTSAGKPAIASVYSVPIAVMLGAESVRVAVENRALEVLEERLTYEIDRELGN